MQLPTAKYDLQQQGWPQDGRHILAHHDENTIVVYQAYRPAIATHALAHGRFGGEFSYSRMSWIKPNFLWMMYRCGWGTKEGQEMTLALRLRRTFFDSILAQAVASIYGQPGYASEAEWNAALKASDVRLQWDPDHNPQGHPLPRRAIQLGLRGAVLSAFGTTGLLEVIDMTEFVAEQRTRLDMDASALETPIEQVYLPNDAAVCARLRLD